MSNNIGTVDRILRILVALTLITLTVMGIVGPWGWIGVVPLVTGLVSWCPAYTLLGIKTCKTA